MEPRIHELTHAVLACLFAALISVGAYIAVPLPGTPVPLVLQSMFIMLAALSLGPWWGLLSVSVYLLFGFLGLPVFSGGSGGIAKLLGPTGGYLVGYLPGVIVMGYLSRKTPRNFVYFTLASVSGMILVYAFGVFRLKTLLDIDWNRALASGFYPFIIGDIIKIVIASLLAPRILLGIDSFAERADDA